jgi:FkbM family methyltransferase
MMPEKVEGRYGPCFVLPNDIYIGQSVINYGEFSKDECEYIVSLANEKKGLVLDVGANVGCISQALLAAGHDVVAFEPQPTIFSLLKLNCPSAKMHKCAVGDKNGTVYFPFIDYEQTGNFGGISVSNIGDVEVPVKTIDSFNFENVSLIKVDVEGFEDKVIQGAIETIKRCKPILYVEVDRPHIQEKLPAILEQLGYTFEDHYPPLFSPDNYFNNTKTIWSDNYVSGNMVCRPIL